MKRDIDGRVTFDENEESLLMLLYQADDKNLRGRLNLTAYRERSDVDPVMLDQIISDWRKKFIVTYNERAGTIQLTPYGQVCAVYVTNKPGLKEKQAQFLSNLYTRSLREKTAVDDPVGPSFPAVDRYVTGRAVGCNSVEVDNICVELQTKNLIEYELKEVKIFEDTSFEQTREVPTKKVRITHAGIETLQPLSNEAVCARSDLPEGRKTDKTSGTLRTADTKVQLQKKPVATIDQGTDQYVENISKFIQTVVFGALAIGLAIVIIFYK